MTARKEINLVNLVNEEKSILKELCMKELNELRAGNQGCDCGGTTCGYYGARDEYDEKDN